MGVLMYSDFSLVYDLLMDDVDYSRWADYIAVSYTHLDVYKRQM